MLGCARLQLSVPNDRPRACSLCQLQLASSAEVPRRWKSFAFRVLEMADAQECTVCMSDLADGSSVTSLPCGHTFHEYCLGQISQAKGIAVTDGSFECPTCRMTNAQATAAEMALSGAAAPASGAAAAAAPAPASVPVLVPRVLVCVPLLLLVPPVSIPMPLVRVPVPVPPMPVL